MSQSQVSIDNLRDFRTSQPRMAEESSLQTFAINLFVKEAYWFCKIVRNIAW